MSGHLGGLNRCPHTAAGPEAQAVDGIGGDLGHEGQRPVKGYPHPVEGGTQFGDSGLPDVARTPLGPGGVEGDRAGRDDHVHRSVGWFGQHHSRSGVRCCRGSPRVGVDEVQAGQGGRVTGVGSDPDLGRGALLGNPAVLEDDNPVCEGGRLYRIVGDQQGGRFPVGGECSVDEVSTFYVQCR